MSTRTTAAAPGAVRLVLTTRFYLAATIAMFVSGLGFSAAAPQIALYLVQDLHASLTTAGLYYLTALTSPIAGYLVGSRSDRTGGRLGLFRICAVAGFVGWLAIAASTQVWMPFVISSIVLAFAGAAGSQLFAALGDELRRNPTPRNDGVVAVVRMALTAGWVVGPVAGSVLATVAGARIMLVATAVCTLAQIVPLGTMRLANARDLADDPVVEAADKVKRRGVAILWPLLAFTGLYVLVYSGESVKYGFLPLYMHDRLHLPAAVSGAIIGIQPLVELVLMPLSIVVARRIGMLRLMVVGAGFGVVANILFATTGNAVGLFAGQILMGGVWAVFAALGIIVAQRLLPDAVATASAIFLSSSAVGSAVGGLTGAFGVSALGLPAVYFAPAVLGAIAVVGLSFMARRHRL